MVLVVLSVTQRISLTQHSFMRQRRVRSAFQHANASIKRQTERLGMIVKQLPDSQCFATSRWLPDMCLLPYWLPR